MARKPTKITFFEKLEPLILSGNKTITIRDESESHYVPGSVVEVFTLETGRKICDIEIQSVEPILFDELSEVHARQECLELPRLKQILREVYPNTEQLYVLSYRRVATNKS